MYELLDTFPAFLTYWARARHLPLDEQISAWATEYLSAWPELLEKQIADYTSQGMDWREIARQRIFPYLEERLPAMQEARQNLLALCAPIYHRAREALGFTAKVTFVIHVGLGCGAGWATCFAGTPAILFGLENIAERGWHPPEALRGLIAHELGHLVHYHWRKAKGKPIGSGPWWQLYEEGFAQRCEMLILGEKAPHQQKSSLNWLAWCQSHRSWLAAEFLRAIDAGRSIRPFFGSWFEIAGHRETGYFLGQEVIRKLEQEYPLQEIALLERLEDHLRPILEEMARNP
ncbi:MAG: hypothetical protein J7M05_01020 [Anaerolineae bacterium]|nr:hypothetical protein [Anaerolineae bacterium]